MLPHSSLDLNLLVSQIHRFKSSLSYSGLIDKKDVSLRFFSRTSPSWYRHPSGCFPNHNNSFTTDCMHRADDSCPCRPWKWLLILWDCWLAFCLMMYQIFYLNGLKSHMIGVIWSWKFTLVLHVPYGREQGTTGIHMACFCYMVWLPCLALRCKQWHLTWGHEVKRWVNLYGWCCSWLLEPVLAIGTIVFITVELLAGLPLNDVPERHGSFFAFA